MPSTTLTNKRPYSIIVWGATGFTGKLVAEYLTTNSTVSFAIAGRSKSKLDQVVTGLQALTGSERFPDGKVPTIIADSGNYESLEAMVTKASVIITTVGPYAKYGELLVKACVENGTDYVDLSGEPHFQKLIIDKYHEQAVANNVLIVNACGFDSLPSDLGTLLIADYFKQRHLQTKNVRLTVKAMKGGPSGGTLDSVVTMITTVPREELRQIAKNADYLVPNAKPQKLWNLTYLHYDEDLKSWQTPFVMEITNRKMVRRSNGFLNYGSEFQYREGVTSSNRIFAFITTLIMSIGAILLMLAPFRWLAQKLLPPGTGPSESQRKNGFFKIDLVGEAENGEKVFVTVKASGDPGYQATSMMISESALCLALDRAKLGQSPADNFKTVKGGVVTAATGMGLTLVERLRKAGMTFDVHESLRIK